MQGTPIITIMKKTLRLGGPWSRPSIQARAQIGLATPEQLAVPEAATVA